MFGITLIFSRQNEDGEWVEDSAPRSDSSPSNDEATQELQCTMPEELDVEAEAPVLAVNLLDEDAQARAEAVVDEPQTQLRSQLEFSFEIASVAWSRGHRYKDSVARRIHDGIWTSTAVRIMCSMPRGVLNHVVYGNLSAAFKAGQPDIAHLYKTEGVPEHEQSSWMHRCNEPDAPAIYVIVLVDQNGHSPTPYQLREIVEMLRRYSTGGDPEEAHEIDRAYGREETSLDNAVAGARHWLNGDELKAAKLHTFCSALRRRIDAMPFSDQDKPLPRPLHYVGYTFSIKQRMKQHQQQTS